MLKKIVITSSLLAASLFVTAQAAAESYFGGSVARARWNINCSQTIKCHTTAASFKLFGGYEFTKHVGVEGSYVYMNDVTQHIPASLVSYNARGADIAAIFKTVPKNNFVGFAKIGMSFMKGEVKTAAGFYQGRAENYSAQPLFGFGGMYNIDSKMSIRAEIDRRNVKISEYANTTFGVTSFSIGLQSTF